MFGDKISGKISAQPHTTLCIQFIQRRENNDKDNTLPLGKQICFTIVWGCAEILPNILVLAPARTRNRVVRLRAQCTDHWTTVQSRGVGVPVVQLTMHVKSNTLYGRTVLQWYSHTSKFFWLDGLLLCSVSSAIISVYFARP